MIIGSNVTISATIGNRAKNFVEDLVVCCGSITTGFKTKPGVFFTLSQHRALKLCFSQLINLQNFGRDLNTLSASLIFLDSFENVFGYNEDSCLTVENADGFVGAFVDLTVIFEIGTEVVASCTLEDVDFNTFFS